MPLCKRRLGTFLGHKATSICGHHRWRKAKISIQPVVRKQCGLRGCLANKKTGEIKCGGEGGGDMIPDMEAMLTVSDPDGS